MKFVVFGLTISSSWGNGHATLWRGLMKGLTSLGHTIVFFEKEVPWYATNRDLWQMWDGAELVLYPDWRTVAANARREVASADVAIVTSYCPDGRAASALVLDEAAGEKLFYDLDTPVTLARLEQGEQVSYLPEQGLGDFDLVLSYTGGQALSELRSLLGARRAAPLYGHVDHYWHKPAPHEDWYAADLSYLGTYAADRQEVVERFLVQPARNRPERDFIVAGSAYPQEIEWPENVRKLEHVPPAHHPSFFSSSRLTLNVTRADMARMGWCPSGRLFEAAACGAAIVSDDWAGLGAFFDPGSEILIARSSEDVVATLDRPDEELRAIGKRARERVLDEHTSFHRAKQLIDLIASSAPAERELAGAEACGA